MNKIKSQLENILGEPHEIRSIIELHLKPKDAYDYIFSDLSFIRSKIISRHLVVCPICREKVAKIKGEIELLDFKNRIKKFINSIDLSFVIPLQKGMVSASTSPEEWSMEDGAFKVIRRETKDKKLIIILYSPESILQEIKFKVLAKGIEKEFKSIPSKEGEFLKKVIIEKQERESIEISDNPKIVITELREG